MGCASDAPPLFDRSTVAAIATPAGHGERGVIRISGPRTAEILRGLWVGGGLDLSGRRAFRGRLWDGSGEQPILVLWMPGPASYTREDVAELHGPGSPTLLRRLFAHLLEAGAEAAGPGEFTRRAFLNGRLDLTRAEGVLSLVEARTEKERRAATALLSGGLERLLGPPVDGLEDLRALAEAGLDFSPEDTGHVEREEQLERGRTVVAELESALAWESARTAPLGLPRVVLYGAPSVGKSTLFNALVERGPAGPAIVHPTPGTTRDRLRGTWHLVGNGPSPSGGEEDGEPGDTWAVELWDTPGPGQDLSGVAGRAQEAAREAWAGADLVLWVADAREPVPGPENAPPGGAGRLLVWSQCDRPDAPARAPASAGPSVRISALTGQGLELLARTVREQLSAETDGGAGARGTGGGEALVRELAAHHRQALVEAKRVLEGALSDLQAGGAEDLFAEGLREASAALGRITGSTAPEALLDRIFGRFCIGK
jgi:tRNA modification GTPase